MARNGTAPATPRCRPVRAAVTAIGAAVLAVVAVATPESAHVGGSTPRLAGGVLHPFTGITTGVTPAGVLLLV